jgi:hypothetical protein
MIITKPRSSIQNILQKSFNYKDKLENIIFLHKIISSNPVKNKKLLIPKILSFKYSKQ